VKIGIFLPNATFDLPGSPEVGGIETFSFIVGEALEKLGHEVVLFGGGPKFGRSHRATSLTLELHPYWETRSIPDIGTRFQRLVQRLHFAWSIRQAWRRHRCDLVLLAKPFDWPAAWWWKRARPELQVVMGFHGTDFFAGDRFFYGAIDGAFAVSPRTADLAEAHVGVRPVFISNPVEAEVFCPDPHAVARESQAPWRLVGSGRFIGWKGFGNLIEAAALIRDRGIDFRLSLAGDGPEAERLRGRTRELSLEDRVTFCGRLRPVELRDLLRSGDLYVVPSVGLDACPIAALEAVCTGLPLLLSDQVGLNDFLSEQDVVSYPAPSVEALRDALLRLHERRGEAAWNDHAARHARLRDTMSTERVARAILALVPPAS
jgi:glycosyltransferase involved in cell wall biosynthesis